MSGNRSLFTYLNDTSPSLVGLSNCKQVMTTKEGSVALDDKLILTDVLYVPELNCNLISVSQLLATSFYRITLLISFV